MSGILCKLRLHRWDGFMEVQEWIGFNRREKELEYRRCIKCGKCELIERIEPDDMFCCRTAKVMITREQFDDADRRLFPNGRKGRAHLEPGTYIDSAKVTRR